MRIDDIPFGTTDWSAVPPTVHPGERGEATSKGHILLCLSGELHTELEDGRTFTLPPGTSCQVTDGAEPHRSCTVAGATLFIVD